MSSVQRKISNCIHNSSELCMILNCMWRWASSSGEKWGVLIKCHFSQVYIDTEKLYIFGVNRPFREIWQVKGMPSLSFLPDSHWHGEVLHIRCWASSSGDMISKWQYFIVYSPRFTLTRRSSTYQVLSLQFWWYDKQMAILYCLFSQVYTDSEKFYISGVEPPVLVIW